MENAVVFSLNKTWQWSWLLGDRSAGKLFALSNISLEYFDNFNFIFIKQRQFQCLRVLLF